MNSPKIITRIFSLTSYIWVYFRKSVLMGILTPWDFNNNSKEFIQAILKNVTADQLLKVRNCFLFLKVKDNLFLSN